MHIIIVAVVSGVGAVVFFLIRKFFFPVEKRPQLVIQTYKSGSGRTARKRYKITQEGIKKVKAMMAASAEA